MQDPSIPSPATSWPIDAQSGARLDFDGQAREMAFLYLVSGNVRNNGQDVTQHNLVELNDFTVEHHDGAPRLRPWQADR
ncbi:MAG: hypothetical protein QM773_18725 [Hyphomonadaceae bacterium]